MLTAAGRAALDALRQEQGLDEKLPWGGRSPRVLTKAYQRFTLEPEASSPDELCDEMLDEQYRRFLNGL